MTAAIRPHLDPPTRPIDIVKTVGIGDSSFLLLLPFSVTIPITRLSSPAHLEIFPSFSLSRFLVFPFKSINFCVLLSSV